jgi:hypothetical protein
MRRIAEITILLWGYGPIEQQQAIYATSVSVCDSDLPRAAPSTHLAPPKLLCASMIVVAGRC